MCAAVEQDSNKKANLPQDHDDEPDRRDNLERSIDREDSLVQHDSRDLDEADRDYAELQIAILHLIRGDYSSSQLLGSQNIG